MAFIAFDRMPPPGHPAPLLWIRAHPDAYVFPPGTTDEQMADFALWRYVRMTRRLYRQRSRDLRPPWRLRFRVALHRAYLLWQWVNGEIDPYGHYHGGG